MIVAKNVHKKYGDVEILKGVNLHIKKGEIIAIVCLPVRVKQHFYKF